MRHRLTHLRVMELSIHRLERVKFVEIGWVLLLVWRDIRKSMVCCVRTIDREVILIFSDTTKIEVFMIFKEAWSDLIASVQGWESGTTLSSSYPVQYPHWMWVYQNKPAAFWISWYMYSFKKCSQIWHRDKAQMQIQSSLEEHVWDAKIEPTFLKLHRTDAKQNSSVFCRK